MMRRTLAPFRACRTTVVALAAASFLAAALEAFALVLIVPIAQSLATPEHGAPPDIPLLHLDASVGVMVLFAAGAVALALALRLAIVVRQTAVVTAWERRRRDELTDAFLDAAWPVQNGERSSTLGQYAAFANFAAGRLNQLVNTLRAGTSLMVLVGGALLVDAWAAVAMLVVGCALALCFRPLVVASRRAASEFADRSIEVANGIEELVSMSRERQVFDASAPARETAHRHAESLARSMRRNHVLSGVITPVYQAIGLLLVCAALGIANAGDHLDVTALGAAAILLLRGLTYGQQLQTAFQKFAEAAPFTEWLDGAIDAYEAARRPVGRAELDGITTIELRDVGFAYPVSAAPSEASAGRAALSHVDLVLRAGDTLGIAGPSGAGKSTLAQILLRLREPTSGRYLVDGIDAREITDSTFATHVTFVPQETLVFHGTVHDNIAFHRPGIGRADVERAAARAGLDTAIAALPDGYDTLLGPGRRELSGGQAQRIGIARALAGTPSMIVLDEPTSALDADNEAIVRETLAALDGSIIVVVIAHRPSTLAGCGRIIVLEEGAIATDAAPDDAERSSAFFARMLDGGMRR